MYQIVVMAVVMAVYSGGGSGGDGGSGGGGGGDGGGNELAFTTPKSEPDFGFGVDPGRLRGYPLAHLAGTWW
jgi:hypothetical protein